MSALADAAAEADALAEAGDERALADLRARWGDDVEAAARSTDPRLRAEAYLAIGRFRFRQKIELLRRGLSDGGAAIRGSSLLALELLSRDHPGVVNGFRPLLHELVSHDPNVPVRRLGVVALKNGSPDRATIAILEGLGANDEEPRELRETAAKVAQLLKKRAAKR